MIRNIPFLFVVLIITLSSCDDKAKKSSEISNSNQLLDNVSFYQGQIGNLPIVMKLDFSNNKVTGEYRYLNQSEFLTLSGQVNSGNLISINELNSEGKLTGQFEGVRTENGVLSGKWNKAVGRKRMLSFLLNPISKEEFFSAKQIDKNINNNDLSGMYHYWVGGEDAPTGEIYYDIIFNGNKDFTFRALGSEEGGSLHAEGKGTLIDEKNGVGSGNLELIRDTEDGVEQSEICKWDCTFKFAFQSKFLEAHEDNCEPSKETIQEECIIPSVSIYGSHLVKLSKEERNKILYSY